MIHLHTAPTPNGWKVSVMLEECNLPYEVTLVNLAEGDQFKEDFLAISPNNRIPAIVDDTRAKATPRCPFSNWRNFALPG